MKTISDTLKASLFSEVTTLATCWKITRTDGAILGFTDHDADLAIDGVTFEAASGYSATAIESSAAMAVDNLNVDGILSSGAITEDDLRAGRYDYAAIEIFMIDYLDIAAGSLILRTGILGEVIYHDGQFSAEVRGLAQKMQQTFTRTYAPTCDADLGDARCTVDLTPFTVTSSVQAVLDARSFSDGARIEADGWFDGGLLTWISGANAGLSMEVKRSLNAGGEIELVQPMPEAIAVDDQYSVYAGCDKRRATCNSKFANVINFRGFPDVPGRDQLMSYGTN